MKRITAGLVLLLVLVLSGWVWAGARSINVDLNIKSFMQVRNPEEIRLELDFTKATDGKARDEDYAMIWWQSNVPVVITEVRSEGFRQLKGDRATNDVLNNWVNYLFETTGYDVTLPAGNSKLLGKVPLGRYSGNSSREYAEYSEWHWLKVTAQLEALLEQAHLVPAGEWRDGITVTFIDADGA